MDNKRIGYKIFRTIFWILPAVIIASLIILLFGIAGLSDGSVNLLPIIILFLLAFVGLLGGLISSFGFFKFGGWIMLITGALLSIFAISDNDVSAFLIIPYLQVISGLWALREKYEKSTLNQQIIIQWLGGFFGLLVLSDLMQLYLYNDLWDLVTNLSFLGTVSLLIVAVLGLFIANSYGKWLTIASSSIGVCLSILQDPFFFGRLFELILHPSLDSALGMEQFFESTYTFMILLILGVYMLKLQNKKSSDDSLNKV